MTGNEIAPFARKQSASVAAPSISFAVSPPAPASEFVPSMHPAECGRRLANFKRIRLVLRNRRFREGNRPRVCWFGHLDREREIRSAKKSQELLPPIQPGETLSEEFLTPLDLSMNRVAHDPRVPLTRIADIVHGRRAVSVDTAFRLARYFGATA